MSQSIRRTVFSAIAATTIGTAALVPTIPATAESSQGLLDSCEPNHCYGIIQWGHSNIAGAEAEFGTYKLDPIDTVEEFITSEFWIGFDGAGLWLEFGVIHGHWCNGNMSLFSAINRPTNFALQCHGAAAESNTKYKLRADEPFDGTWNLYKNGAYITGYANAPTGTGYSNIGHETTNEAAKGSMTGGNLRFKYQSTGQWANGWASTNWPAGDPNPNGSPCYSLYVSKPTDMRARCNIAPTLADSPQEYPLVKPLKPAVEAKRLASSNGTLKTDSKMLSVETTRANALSSIGANGSSDPGGKLTANRPATVIQMEGDFHGKKIPTPANFSNPTGTSMTFVFDKETDEMLAVSLSKTPLDLAQMGQIQSLDMD